MVPPYPNDPKPGGHKDLEAKGQLYHVRARFKALCEGALVAASDFSCKFFHILTSGFEQCLILPFVTLVGQLTR